MTEEPINEPCQGPIQGLSEIARGWVLISVSNADDAGLVQLSTSIIDEFAEELAIYDDLDETGLEEAPPAKMVIRADITTGPFQIIASISAPDHQDLCDMRGRISGLVEERFGQDVTVDLATVVLYSPFPSTCAPSYVAPSEAFNPRKGYKPTGANAWG